MQPLNRRGGRYPRTIDTLPRTQHDEGLEECLAEIDARLAEIQRDLGAVADWAHETPVEDPEPEPHAPESYAPEIERDDPEPVGAHNPDPPPRAGREGPLADLLKRAPTRPRPAARPPPAPLPEPEEPSGGLQAVSQLQGTVGELLRACAGVLEASAKLTVSVGPFSSTAKVKEFELRLAELPGVGDVSVRGYEGEDRAILDVRLS